MLLLAALELAAALGRGAPRRKGWGEVEGAPQAIMQRMLQFCSAGVRVDYISFSICAMRGLVGREAGVGAAAANASGRFLGS